MKPTKKSFLETLKSCKIHKKVIDAFDEFDQKDFFDMIFRGKFYSDETIPIGFGETSDHFLTLARMINYGNPKASSRVLEIGTGSGYSTALLSSLAREVVTVEFNEQLASAAKKRLASAGMDNVRFFAGDGTCFESEGDAFDVIIVFASCYTRPLSLLRLLRAEGRMVFPMGPLHQQQIAYAFNEMVKSDEGLIRTEFREFCTFKPIQGQYGTELFHLIDRDNMRERMEQEDGE